MQGTGLDLVPNFQVAGVIYFAACHQSRKDCTVVPLASWLSKAELLIVVYYPPYAQLFQVRLQLMDAETPIYHYREQVSF